jgi:hypothetical protein
MQGGSFWTVWLKVGQALLPMYHLDRHHWPGAISLDFLGGYSVGRQDLDMDNLNQDVP